jgi:hypothetical protein
MRAVVYYETGSTDVFRYEKCRTSHQAAARGALANSGRDTIALVVRSVDADRSGQ